MNLQVGASVLGLVATLCDIVFTRREEAQHIWKKPLRITLVRCLFVLMRYLPVAVHIIYAIFASMWMNGAEGVPEEHNCNVIMIFRIITGSIMILLLDMILMLRVFALYNRSRLIGILLLFSLALRIGLTTYTTRNHQPEKIMFNSYCVAKYTFRNTPGRGTLNPVLLYMSVRIKLGIIALAMKRTLWDFRRYSYSLFSVLNRDGLIVFCTIGVTMAGLGVASLVKKGAGAATVLVFPSVITLVSAAGCHTILNLQKLELANAGANSTSQKSLEDRELTAIEDVPITAWDSPWDTNTFQIIEPDQDTALIPQHRPIEL
ncbi:hypothetical protein BDP27DRAFT_1453625 [Rhodocollybia butyracea]|uniref:DUF6533 domain-containing protein n=1 Tax=Rhodocollybia butyracea TaxID=206335 RepID=A0A9P5P8W8_9AGAR|nr:hypothetical protein BDP27DRAFT_1453625 [Rhodocollybia butyracea]